MPTQDWSAVSASIASAEATGATVGVAVISPAGGRFQHNGARRFAAASTVKIAIMIELFRRIDAGTLDLAQRHSLTEADRAGGSGVLAHLGAGIAPSIGDLAYLMMSISDNTATNLLIDRVGIPAVNATMRSLGMAESVLGRPMRGRLALPGEQENWALPGEYAEMIAAILSNRAASAAACAQMLGLLEKQQNDRRIARYLPRQDRPRWGSKTGSNTGVVNDVGYIFTKAGPLVVAVFVENPTDPLAGEQIIGEIARSAIADLHLDGLGPK